MFKRLFASRNRPCFASPSSWDTLVYDLSGNRLEITLPPQDYEFPEDDNGKRFNLFEPTLYKYNSEPDRNGNPAHQRGISRDAIWRRNWYTYGPVWQAQHIGTLQSAAVICDISRMPSQLNCFNPEQMERLIIHGLYYSKGPVFTQNEYSTPVNWQIKQLHGTNWIYFETWPRTAEWEASVNPHDAVNFSIAMITPLFMDKYLFLSFSSTGSLPAKPSNRLMNQRIQQIIPSIKLTLSPEAQKQRTEAHHRFPDAKYSPSRAPEAWKYYGSYREGDYAKGEEFHIFEGSCSPPPELY